ncbi:MAG: SDR family oxidoreductase [Rhizobiaceae bacterium]|nr:SDR family oxidoreductase [Rhizobiaceae bacterium]
MVNTVGRLSGRRALITGAAGGIAQETARHFAREGAQLLLTDLDAAALAPLVDELQSAGAVTVTASADLTNRSDVEDLIACGEKELGGLEILVTCAGGYTSYANFEEIEEEDWDGTIELNLKTVYLCCKAVIPLMKRAGWGRIINIGSLAGRSTSAGTSPAHYATAKAGVSILTQYIAKDVAEFGITANTIAPGTTSTDRVRRVLTPDRETQFVARTPVGRLAEPKDIAGVITFLGSNESSYITGATLDVNGGRLMLT